MDFEQLLDIVGGGGRYQIVAYLLIGLSVIPTGMHNLANVFLTGLTDYHCMPAEPIKGNNVNYTDQHEMAADLISDWSAEDGKLGTCQIYDVDYADWSVLTSLNRSHDMPADMRSCNYWRYDTSVYGNTITDEWDLVCGNGFKRSLAQSIYMCGVLLGAIVFGSLADSIGRKRSWGISMLLLVVFGSAAAFAPEYWSHVFLRFISGMAAAGLFTCGFVLGAESISKTRRLAPAVLYQIWFCFGYMLVDVGVAYLSRNYVITQLTLSLLVIVGLVIYWFIDESPRWLLTQGKTKEATVILEKIAKTNGATCTPEVISKAVNSIAINGEQTQTQSYSVLDLLKTPNLRKKTLNLWFNWFIISMVYYGLSMGSSDLAGSPYLNLFVSGFVEIPGLILAYLVAQKFGRRIAMFVFMVGGGLACLFMLAIPSSYWLILSLLANTGKMGISGAFGVVYVFSAEISPTVVRTVGVGSGSMSARVGSLIAPFIGDLGLLVWRPLPILVFGTTSVLAGCMSLWIPETLNQTLPDTIAEGEKFGKNHTIFNCCGRSNKMDIADEEKCEPLNGHSTDVLKEPNHNHTMA